MYAYSRIVLVFCISVQHRTSMFVDFIASLAVSDFLIGLFSMPLYTAYLLLDENWVLGSFVCNLWCARLL